MRAVWLNTLREHEARFGPSVACYFDEDRPRIAQRPVAGLRK